RRVGGVHSGGDRRGGQPDALERRPLRAARALLPRLLYAARDRDRASRRPARRGREASEARMTYVVAVDSGGTFTDCVVLDENGSVTRAKAPSTPPRFEDGVLASVGDAAKRLPAPLEGVAGRA